MGGRAVILSTGAVIAPFGDPVSRSFFAGQTLAETQDEAFAKCRLEVVRVDTVAEALEAVRTAPSGPTLILLDHMYLSWRAARDFVKTARKGPRPAALTLTINASVDYALPLHVVLRDGDLVVHDVDLVDREDLPAADDEGKRTKNGKKREKTGKNGRDTV